MFLRSNTTAAAELYILYNDIFYILTDTLYILLSWNRFVAAPLLQMNKAQEEPQISHF